MGENDDLSAIFNFRPLKRVEGKMVASLLMAGAEIHYGYYYLGDNKEHVISKEYVTSEEERARLAETSFVRYGCTFESFKEVERVTTLFQQRYRYVIYNLAEKEDRERIENDIKSILMEIRYKYRKETEEKQNEVDKLEGKIQEIRKEISDIQSKCSHDYRLSHEPVFAESKKIGTYIAYRENGSQANFTIRCLKCNDEEVHCINSKCPRCLNKMERGDMYLREIFFENDHPYYGARMYRCSNAQCKFKAVADEWDR